MFKGIFLRKAPTGDSLCEVDDKGNVTNGGLHASIMETVSDDTAVALARDLLGDSADDYGDLFKK